MICPNCGTENADFAKFCGKCGADLRLNKAVPIPEQPFKPEPERLIEPPAPKKKKSKKAIIIAAAAVVLAAAIAVGALLVLKPFDKAKSEGGSSDGTAYNFKVSLGFELDGKKFVNLRRPFYTEDGSKYYGAENLFDNQKDLFAMQPNYTCFDGEKLFEITKGVIRYDFKDGKFVPEYIADSKKLKESYFSGAVCSPVPYDDSIYFYSSQGYGKAAEPFGRIGKIDKTSGEIERVGDADITTYSFTICDGWIYYLDNDMEKKGDKAGVYKMKTDGSEKTLLYRRELNGGLESQSVLADGDYIYFIDNSFSKAKPSLNRIKKDGSGYELLAELDSSAAFTAFNFDGNTLYYVSKENGANRLNTLNTETLEKQENLVTDFAAAEYVDVIDGYLYTAGYSLSKTFKGASKTVSSTDPNYPDKYSIRYKISENCKPEYFYAYKTDDGICEGYWQGE